MGYPGDPRPPASGTDPLLKDEIHLLQVQTPCFERGLPLPLLHIAGPLLAVQAPGSHRTIVIIGPIHR